MKPLISVIVPVYNVADFVGKCLGSIARQNYKNLDIVVVDDGSTDESGKICDEFAKKEKRVRVFHKENGGLSDARNFGIKKAKGKIVAFVDSDDFVSEDFIGTMYKHMAGENADIVVCGYNLTRPKEETVTGKQAAIKLLVGQENVDIVTWNKLYKKKLFVDNNIYFPKGEKHEDSRTTYKLFSKAENIMYISEPLYVYVDRKSSLMNTAKVEGRLKERESVAKEAVEYFKNDVDLKQAAEVSLLLAKYALLDFAIAGKIEPKYGSLAKEWIKKHKKNFANNKYLTDKLKFYNLISTNFGGRIYWLFRKIIHE